MCNRAAGNYCDDSKPPIGDKICNTLYIDEWIIVVQMLYLFGEFYVVHHAFMQVVLEGNFHVE